jgi:hypothetical protein
MIGLAADAGRRVGSLHVVSCPPSCAVSLPPLIHLVAVDETTIGYLARWNQVLLVGRLLSEAVWRFDIQRRAVTSVGWTFEASLVDFVGYKHVGIGLVVGNTLLLLCSNTTTNCTVTVLLFLSLINSTCLAIILLCLGKFS